MKRERLEAWKAKKAAEAASSGSTSVPAHPVAASTAASSSSKTTLKPTPSSAAARLGLPVSASLPPKPQTAAPGLAGSTVLRSAPVGLPKKPSFNAFGKATSRGPARATAAGMMGDDEEETKALYKPEEGLAVESGLEPDKPTAAQLEEIKRQEEALTNGDAHVEEEDEDDTMDLDGEMKPRKISNGSDDELADGGPSVKAAPLSSAQREAEREEREAAEIEARSQIKMEVDGEEAEIDPLDAFMMGVSTEVKKVNQEDAQKIFGNGATNGTADKGKGKSSKLGLIDAFDNDSDEDAENAGPVDLDDIDKTALTPAEIMALAQKKLKKKELASVDHSKIKYEPFMKAFYHPPPEIQEMTNEEAEALRVELDNIKIRGLDCPKPITKWSHCGLPAVW